MNKKRTPNSIYITSIQLVSRQKAAKKKGPVPLTAAMLNELNKNHMGGIDNYGNEELYNVDDGWGDEKEPPYVSSSKRGGWADEKEPPYSKHEFKSKVFSVTLCYFNQSLKINFHFNCDSD